MSAPEVAYFGPNFTALERHVPAQPRQSRSRGQAAGLWQDMVDGRTRWDYRATTAGRQALAEDRKALAERAREVLGNDTPA